MNITKSLKSIIALAVAGTFSASTVAAPSNAEIYDMMQEMKQELKILKAENNKLKGTVEDVAVSTDEAIKAQMKIANKSHWGGYGEIHGNWLEGDTAGTADTDKIDAKMSNGILSIEIKKIEKIEADIKKISVK